MASIAEIGVVVLLSIFIVLHLAVIFKWIPYNLVWGSRLKTDKEMYHFEAVSLLVILFFLWVTFENTNFVSRFLSNRTIDIVFWIMTILFAFNTLGNLFSKNRIERCLFTPLAFLLVIFCLMIALK